jgi:hypothetical protein
MKVILSVPELKITFIRYTQNQKNGRPNNLMFGSNTKYGILKELKRYIYLYALIIYMNKKK